MPRPASGSVEVRKLRDGTSSVRARFRHKGERYPVVFGRDVDGWTEARGRRELQMILAQLSAGVPIEQVLARYEPEPAHDEDEYAAGITMHEYASDWLERKRVGEIGEGPLAENTYEDYLWRLKKYILPTSGEQPWRESATWTVGAFAASCSRTRRTEEDRGSRRARRG